METNPPQAERSHWPAEGKTLFPYSLANFRELIMEVLQTAKAATIVEIGSELGGFTEVLCAHAQKSSGRLISIDPFPPPSALKFIQAHDGRPYFQFIQKPSLEVLPYLQADAYIIDGDHNYYTVRQELELIARQRGDAPWVAILHDVCWPCGRRDGYYDPAMIPIPHRRAYSHDISIAPGNPGVAKAGMRSNRVMAFALEEGGPANGIRTAVEDFLAGKPEFKFVVIPAFLGLGIVSRRSAPWSEALAKYLAPYASNPLLERLETNRLELFVKVVELENELSAQNQAHSQQEAWAKLPTTAPGQRLLAKALFIEQQWAEAGLLFQALVHHFPDDLEIWQSRLECARRRNHHGHAKLILNDALRFHPEWSAILGVDNSNSAQAA